MGCKMRSCDEKNRFSWAVRDGNVVYDVNDDDAYRQGLEGGVCMPDIHCDKL